MGEQSVVPNSASVIAESARDPLSKMIEIAKDKELKDPDKTTLISYAQKRFVNRRRMAYISLGAIVASLFLLFLAAFIDGLSSCLAIDADTAKVFAKAIAAVDKDTAVALTEGAKACKGILVSIKENQSLITWVEGFLTSIVAAYYGVSSWRPAS